MRLLLKLLIALGVFLVCTALGVCVWFDRTPPVRACVACHEMRAAAASACTGVHTNVACTACHGRLFGSMTDFEEGLRRFWAHVTVTAHPQLEGAVRSPERAEALTARCGACHAARYRQWQRSAHLRKGGTSPSRVNTTCLACHQAHAPTTFAVYSPALGFSQPLACENVCRSCHAGKDGEKLKTMRDMQVPKERK